MHLNDLNNHHHNPLNGFILSTFNGSDSSKYVQMSYLNNLKRFNNVSGTLSCPTITNNNNNNLLTTNNFFTEFLLPDVKISIQQNKKKSISSPLSHNFYNENLPFYQKSNLNNDSPDLISLKQSHYRIRKERKEENSVTKTFVVSEDSKDNTEIKQVNLEQINNSNEINLLLSCDQDATYL